MKLLSTKLRPPALPKRLLTRPRLLDILDNAADFKVCLLSAPTGYGKTTLVHEWLMQGHLAFAWLTLDDGDNEPNRFLSYLTEAISGILPQTTDRLVTPLPFADSASIETYLTALINQVADVNENLVLILNDYETITSGQCHAALEFFIEYAPENLHVFLLTRVDPPLPLARWRARQQLLELRTPELRFTREEMRDFLVEVMHFTLTEDEITALDQHTQGWAASLRLFMLSMQNTSKKQQFFKALDDSQSHIMDFLVDEALSHLSDEMQAFLYRISILPRFSGALCQAVTGNPHSESILRDLERHNLFITHFDDDHQWYRFHPLFAECLVQRLQEQEHIDIAELHRKASDWHASKGNVDDALEYAFAAQDFDRVAKILESYVILWIDQGDYFTFTRWLDKMPREKIINYPRLSAFVLYGLVESRNIERYEALAHIQKELENLPEIRPFLKAIQANAAFMRGNYQQALQIINKALGEFHKHPPQSIEDLFANSFVLSARIGTYIYSGQLAESDTAIAAAIPIFLQAGLTGFAIDSLGARASIKMKMGHLHRAEELLEQGAMLLRRWGSESGHGLRALPTAIRIYGPYSRLCYEQNRLNDSITMANRAIESFQQGGYVWGWRVMEVYATLGLAHLGLADITTAFDSLKKIQQVENLLAGYPIIHTPTRLDATCQKIRLALTLASEDNSLYHLIEEWIMEIRKEDQQDNEQISAVWARYLITQKRMSEAKSIIQQIIHKAESAGRTGDLIEYLVMESSEPLMRRALQLAEPQNYCRTFVDGGEHVQKLLMNIDSPYARKLLQMFPKTTPETKQGSEVPWLNISERQILKLLGNEYSNQQIADELHLSVNTVKWYARRIYALLGANNRREAILKARQLGML